MLRLLGVQLQQVQRIQREAWYLLLMNPHENASHFLASLDTDWARLVGTVGGCQLLPDPEQQPYEALVRAVAYQQLHARAGDAILARLLAQFSERMPQPQQLIAADFALLRGCGFSSSKIATIKTIAEATVSGLVPDRQEADLLRDEELIARLTQLKGIGRWTVEMLLIFTLERADVLPADDLGVREGYRRLKQLPHAPRPAELRSIGAEWSPYRSIAAWYLWRVPK